MKRRNFILNSALFSASIGIPLSLKSQELFHRSNIISENFAIQLYSVRDSMKKDPKATLKELASYGYKYIEGYESSLGLFWGMTNLEFKKFLDDLGLTMISSHCGDTNNLESFNKKSSQAAEIGMKHLICPWAEGDRTIDQFKRNAEIFNKCGEISQQNGMKFAYHNHDYSFKKVEGEYLQDVLMTNTDINLVDYEMDIYWVVAAGEDPIKWFNKYPDRFNYCHVKDYLALAENKSESCSLGKGSIDFPAILAHGKTKGLKNYIVEQEQYTGTSQLEAAKDNFNYMKSLKV